MRLISLKINVGPVVKKQNERERAYNNVKVPFKINEIELKEKLKGMGFISSDKEEYSKTKLFLLKEENLKMEIGLEERRTLDDLDMKDDDIVIIIPGKMNEKGLKELNEFYNSGRFINRLYVNQL